MSNDLQRFFEQAQHAQGYPKLLEGDPGKKGHWIRFELANGRVLTYLPEHRAERFILHDGEEMVARAVRYLDEESDVRTHVYTYFAREDYPEWKNQDKNPHIYLDYEVSNRGNLQTVSLQKCLKSLCMDGKRWEETRPYGDQKPHPGNADFVTGEAETITALHRFYDYAVGTILRGNKPDFETLNVLFDQPFIAHGMVPTSDVQADSYGSFAI